MYQEERRNEIKEVCKSLIYQIGERTVSKESKENWKSISSNEIIKSLTFYALELKETIQETLNKGLDGNSIKADIKTLNGINEIVKGITPNNDFLVPENVGEMIEKSLKTNKDLK